MGKKTNPPPGAGRRNPVARHSHKVNRPAAFQDRTRYRRSAKHKGEQPCARTPAAAEGFLRKAAPASLPGFHGKTQSA